MLPTSPLRYPGGKSRFTSFINDALLVSGEVPKILVEPFCGGAGASIKLLEEGRVERIALNDLDPLVSSFWSVVFGKSRSSAHDVNWLINSIETAELSINEWNRQKLLKPKSVREAAWKCFYLNRTSFNGILYKAGPIGGRSQLRRTLDVRFNRENLSSRILELYKLRDLVANVECVHWKHFCTKFKRLKKVYLYCDPPYFRRAEQLYGYLFDTKAHENLSNYLCSLSTPWMLSYDDAPEIRKLYNKKGISGRVIDNTYSAHPIGGNSFVGRELFYSNRKLPKVVTLKKGIVHEGLTVVGSVKRVTSESEEPIRIPILNRLLAVGC